MADLPRFDERGKAKHSWRAAPGNAEAADVIGVSEGTRSHTRGSQPHPSCWNGVDKGPACRQAFSRTHSNHTGYLRIVCHPHLL